MFLYLFYFSLMLRLTVSTVGVGVLEYATLVSRPNSGKVCSLQFAVTYSFILQMQGPLKQEDATRKVGNLNIFFVQNSLQTFYRGQNSKTLCFLPYLARIIDSWVTASFRWKNEGWKGLKGRFKGRIGLLLWNKKRFSVKSCLLGGIIFCKIF